MDTQYVTISKLQDLPTKGEWTDIAIAGHSIKFLQSPLLDHFSGKMNQSGDSTYWKLHFFDKTEHEVGLFVSFRPGPPKQTAELLAKAIWQATTGETTLQGASQWLRGSHALKREDYEDRGNLLLGVDGAGISVFSEESQRSRFERAVLLLALACAYRHRIETLVAELASWDSDCAELSKLARKATAFNARCYFRHPVLMERVELPYIWDKIADRMRLQSLNQELLDQLHMLLQLIAADERDHAATERENAHRALEYARDRESRRWQIVQIILILIPALQIIGFFLDGSHGL